jgi:hypothetical protein
VYYIMGIRKGYYVCSYSYVGLLMWYCPRPYDIMCNFFAYRYELLKYCILHVHTVMLHTLQVQLRRYICVHESSGNRVVMN